MDEQPASRRPTFAHELVLGAGLTFAISRRSGEIDDTAIGLVCRDVRHLSTWVLHIDGVAIEWLGADVPGPDVAVAHGFATLPGHADPPLEITRRRQVVHDAMEESVELRWWGLGQMQVDVAVDVNADFADIFDVRTGDVPTARPGHPTPPDRLTFAAARGTRATEVAFDPAPDAIDAHGARWHASVARDAPWRLHATAACVHGEPTSTTASASDPSQSMTVATVPPDLGRAVAASVSDLGMLTMHDALAGDRPVLAAGIPWYVALFGRDSLIASHQARTLGLDRLLGALHALAARQGTTLDPANDEAPSKILHEARFAQRPWLGTAAPGANRPYYGTVDATALFVIMLGQAMRWGASRQELVGLLPAGRATMEWLRGPRRPGW